MERSFALAPKRTYSDWSKEELIKRVHALEKRKKYGLVWDEERTKEKFEADAEGKLPVLKEVKARETKTDPEKPTHILIEGDNYHSLSVLNYTHEKSIDVVYIDPPYNTGATDWKYNNHYVDINDAWRHSKWLTMMKNRLQLVPNLLKKDGVVIVTIDDNEACTLGLLLEEIFPGKERATVVIKYNPAGTARNGFSRSHEYAYFLLNPGQEIEKRPAPPDVRDQNLRRHGNGANRQDSPTMFFPICVDKKTLRVINVGDVPPDNFHPKKQTIETAKYYEVWPLDNRDKEKRWYYGKARIQARGHDELTCKWIKDRLHVYFHTDNESEQKYQSVWVGSEYDSGAHGGSLVRDIVGQQFPFPKSLYAVRDCLNAIVRNKKNAVILDFFAGSGTTGHATLDLNKDGGNRQFILCTNNENNICESICHPRIERVIRGYKDLAGENVEGLHGNLKYYRTAFVASEPTDRNKGLLTKETVEMLCLRENTFDLVSESDTVKIYRNKDRFTGIIFDQLSIPKFKRTASKFGKPASVYVFSLGDDDFADEFTDLKNVKVCSIPEAILRVYRRIFQ